MKKKKSIVGWTYGSWKQDLFLTGKYVSYPVIYKNKEDILISRKAVKIKITVEEI